MGVRARRTRQGDEKLAVDALRAVKHIVTPNTEHLTWARRLDPGLPRGDERVPGLIERKPRSATTSRSAPRAHQRPGGGEFDLCWIEEERSPFKLLGDRPFFSEVVFVPQAVARAARDGPLVELPGRRAGGVKFGMDRIYRPVYNGLMKQPGWEAKIAPRFDQWDWDFLAPCHGEPVQGPDVKRTAATYATADV